MQIDSYVPRPGSTGRLAQRGTWTSSEVSSARQAVIVEAPVAWQHLEELEGAGTPSKPQSLEGAVAVDIQLGVLARLHPSSSFMELADLAWLIRLDRRTRLGLTTANADFTFCKIPQKSEADVRKYYPTRNELAGRGRQLVAQPEACLPDTHLERLHTKAFQYVATDLTLYEARLGTAEAALALDTWMQIRGIPVEIHEAAEEILGTRRNEVSDLDLNSSLSNMFKNWSENVLDRPWHAWEVEEAFSNLRQMFPEEWEVWRDVEKKLEFDSSDPRIGLLLYKGVEILHPEAFGFGDTILRALLREKMHSFLKHNN